MYRKVSKREYVNLFLQTLSINSVKEMRLNATEIRLLIEIVFFSAEDMNPYNGRGREIMMNEFQFNQQRYSGILKSLCNKKYLIKMNNGQYVVNLKLQDMINSLEVGKKLMIAYNYEISRDT